MPNTDRPRSAAAVVTAALAASCVASPPRPAPAPAPEASRSLTYVALGDSLAAGTSGVRSYVSRFAGHLRRSHDGPVEVRNLARGGMRSDDLLALLRTSRVRAAVAEADVVTWNIGGNDMAAALTAYRSGECGDVLACLGEALGEVRRRWVAIADEIAGLREGSGGTVRTMNDYNPFVSYLRATGRLAVVRELASELARFKCETARARGFECADVYAAFNGPDGRRDPMAAGLVRRGDVHPTALGQRTMAEALIALGEEVPAA